MHMTVATRQTDSAVLTSWKEIASFLGKGVRTVQRWEKHFGLPVRRPVRGCKSMVLACPDEISTWIRRQELAQDRIALVEPDRSALLQQIEALQAEVQDLKHQLQMVLARSA